MSDLSNRIVETEKVLQGIPLVDIGSQYYFANKKQIYKTYLLPIKCHHHQIEGLYLNQEEKLDSVPIGFSFDGENLQQTTFYQPNYEGNLSSILQSSNRIYLPLKITPLQQPTNRMPILGINGAQGSFPLIYIIDSNQDILYRGLFQNQEGKVEAYMAKGNAQIDAQIREVLKEMSQGKIHAMPHMPNLKQKEKPKIEIVSEDIDWKKPQEIINYINRTVIGQEDIKKAVAGAFSDYLIKVHTKDSTIMKRNVIIPGPTGVGKTLLAETLAKLANLPFCPIKMGGKTPEGYIGDNMSSEMITLREKAPDEEAPYGIVLLDEIDKITGLRPEIDKRMQNQLLGWVGKEGDTINFYRHGLNTSQPLKPLETKNLFFIATGAFTENGEGKSLEEIMQEGQGQKQIGFRTTPIQNQKNSTKATHDDLIRYGLIPELVGRFPVIGTAQQLTTKQIAQIFRESDTSVWLSYKNLFQHREIQIELDESIPELIAKKCPKETGARALDTISAQLFDKIIFHAENLVDRKRKIKVTPELAQEILSGDYQPQEEKLLIAY